MVAMDRYNEIILQALLADGRISNVELAEKIGLSPSACLRRVQELESKGLIKGYRAVLDSALLGVEFIAYVGVGLRDHSMASQSAFEAAIERSLEVKECHNVTGTFEYLLRVETRNLQAYKAFHADVLGAIPQVSNITTHVVMESTKDERA
ncbi:Lrp/AsnC family transcriptional regulator [Pseudoalteromonas sp. SMS1]|uniref:Lrp/AsnC family transcriptional regulator n=1 Tax=Pseudoalteromonas sp. SMS1 TaxID=2908894 RepID=UPI001F1DC4AA|nr:Lrp/AsnC family transcriptional regulator [Pseudoalteromonas sp. SMS1]MCF2859478.1 Lrp/AsnC family transcriptional regulator [Pseudoalteromonas sp. SMS1]